jgi:hypothetical protein
MKLQSYPTLPVVIPKVLTLHKRALQANVPYKWGGKAACLTAPEALRGIDCSGYVGWLLAKGSGCQLTGLTGIGTFHLAARMRGYGLKRSSVESGALQDGILRVAVTLTSGDWNQAGHTALIYNGRTLESHGSAGVNSRFWHGGGWQRFAIVWCVCEDGGTT